MIDHMAEMRRKIEEMQERARECHSIAEGMLEEILIRVAEAGEEKNECVTRGELTQPRRDGAAERGNASPDYEPPGSPEYIPPQDDMETEVSQSHVRFKCGLCSFVVEGKFDLFMHIEEEHDMEGAEEDQLEKYCIEDDCKEQDGNVPAKEKSELDPEAQKETGVKTGNMQESEVVLKKQVVDENDTHDETNVGEDIVAKAHAGIQMEDEDPENGQDEEQDPAPSPSSLSPGVVSNIQELQVIFYYTSRLNLSKETGLRVGLGRTSGTRLQ